MEPEPFSDEAVSRLAVFPLPSTVLFPGTVLPLHIFEPRYRAMVADALATDKAMAIVLAKDEPSDMNTPAAVHEVATAGRIIHAETLPDGRFNILLHGMQRVRLLEELNEGRLYRTFRAELIPQPDEAQLERASRELGRLQSCVLSLTSALETTDEQLVEVLRATPDPVQLADILAAAVVSDSDLQQRLLSQDDFGSRISKLIDVLADFMVRAGPPPRSSAELN